MTKYYGVYFSDSSSYRDDYAVFREANKTDARKRANEYKRAWKTGSITQIVELELRDKYEFVYSNPENQFAKIQVEVLYNPVSQKTRELVDVLRKNKYGKWVDGTYLDIPYSILGGSGIKPIVKWLVQHKYKLID